MQNKAAWLILENGKIWNGKSVGAVGTAVGEMIFHTGMIGCMELLTDPASFGKMIVRTFPVIGCSGVTPDEESDRVYASGLIVRELCDSPSNFRSTGNLQEYLEQNHVVGICDVDTRALTRILRDNGSMTAMITDSYPDNLPHIIEQLRNAKTPFPRKNTDVSKIGNTSAEYSVALWDFGVTYGFIDSLLQYGFEIVKVGSHVENPLRAAGDMLGKQPDVLIPAGGMANVTDYPEAVNYIASLDEKTPLFGVGVGFEIMAAAHGMKAEKLTYGHHGDGQPVLSVTDGKIYITAQSHDYTVKADTLPKGAEILYRNANDGTVEGIAFGKKKFGVAFTPKASGGSQDTGFLFEKLVTMLKEQ